MRLVAVVAVGAVAATLAGCVPDYVKLNNSPDLFRIVAINGGLTLTSDVSSLTTDPVTVVVAVRPKNPRNTNVPQIAEAIIIEQYRVRFFRTDGRDVEGVDVPFSFSGALNAGVDIGTGSGANVTLVLPLVRAQAKQEPPLRNLRNAGLAAPTPTPNGTVITPRVTMIAEIAIFGRTIAGEAVSDTGRMTVDFVDLP